MNETEALFEQLRDIRTPPVSQIPALGWWLLGFSLVVLIYLLWRVRRRYQRRAWVREAKQELHSIKAESTRVPVADSLTGTSKLERRILLAAKPRTDVAGLHGEQWLKELDSVCGRDLFSNGYGRMLRSGPYQRQPDVKVSDLSALFDVMSELISAAGRYNQDKTAS